MMQETSLNDEKSKEDMIQNNSSPIKKPNESGYLWIEDRIKIFDPATKETFVQGRT